MPRRQWSTPSQYPIRVVPSSRIFSPMPPSIILPFSPQMQKIARRRGRSYGDPFCGIRNGVRLRERVPQPSGYLGAVCFFGDGLCVAFVVGSESALAEAQDRLGECSWHCRESGREGPERLRRPYSRLSRWIIISVLLIS